MAHHGLIDFSDVYMCNQYFFCNHCFALHLITLQLTGFLTWNCTCNFITKDGHDMGANVDPQLLVDAWKAIESDQAA